MPTVHILDAGQLNTYDVLVSDDVVFTQAAFERFVAGPARGSRPRRGRRRTRRERRLMSRALTARRPRTPATSSIKPVVSEKSYALLDENKYTFIVAPGHQQDPDQGGRRGRSSASRSPSVNTINRQGKRKRTRSGFGKRKDTKRAIVTVDPNNPVAAAREGRIELFGGPVSERVFRKYDRAVIGRLRDLDHEARPVCATFGDVMLRLSPYGGRAPYRRRTRRER